MTPVPPAGVASVADIDPEEAKRAALLASLTPEVVERYLRIPFKLCADFLQDRELDIQPHELALMREPALMLAEKYLPEMLKKTDSPELAMLGAALMAYGTRVGLHIWQKSKESKDTNQTTNTNAKGAGAVASFPAPTSEAPKVQPRSVLLEPMAASVTPVRQASFPA